MSRQRGWRCGLEGGEAGLRPGAHVEGAEAGLSASLGPAPSCVHWRDGGTGA